MYSRQLVILFVNENGPLETLEILNLILSLFLINQSSHILAASKVEKLWDNAWVMSFCQL